MDYSLKKDLLDLYLLLQKEENKNVKLIEKIEQILLKEDIVYYPSYYSYPHYYNYTHSQYPTITYTSSLGK